MTDAPSSFESERLLMKPLERSDCTSTYLSWMCDPEVNRFLETRHYEQSIESIANYVAAVNARANEHIFGIFRKDNGRHIGNIKVGPISAVHLRGDVSLLIGDRASWGQGFATEAIWALSHYSFLHLGVNKLAAGMYVENQGSFRAFLKAGYRQEGLRYEHGVVDGKPQDIIECGLLRRDFQILQEDRLK